MSEQAETQERPVVAMATRKVHRPTCRFVDGPGSMNFPFADATAVAVLPHCKVCAGR